MSRNIPDKEMKALIALSGGVCAFPGCNKHLLESGNTDDDAAFLGEMAHIVADSHQGPRGISSLTDEERDKHTNLLLLCGDHHKVIDSQPRTYSVPVLRRIKDDHEGRILRATSGPVPPQPPTLTREVIHSSLLAVTHLPAAVFAAPCAFHEGQDDQVKERLHFPDEGTQLVRFILRDNKLFSFHNLKDPKGPFRDVINQKGVETIRSEQWWDDPEGHRRYVTLLNRGLYKYAARKRGRFDPAHKRFFFDALTPGQPRQEQYRPLNAKTRKSRNIVWQPKIKATGEPRNYWWHLAAGLAFLRVDKRQWGFSIRPERHLTSDGVTPLPPKQIGRRVTSKKARMWNDIYLGEVNFWRDYLSGGNQKIVLNFGDQSAVIDTEMLAFGVDWPGIPGDTKLFTNTTYHLDLFFRPLGESSTLRTSVVQAFDENGEGLVLRGHRFHWDDRRGRSPHLMAEMAEGLIEMVMQRYQAEQKQLPRRVVIHKTSRFEPLERSGFEGALKKRGCLYDLVALTPSSGSRLLRAGQYPPLRGTLFSVGAVSWLYTTGYLPALGKYPHGHVPSPLQVADHVGDTAKADLLREVMVLTKMNWNSASMGGLKPITLRFAELVGDVLREVPADREPQPKYKFY